MAPLHVDGAHPRRTDASGVSSSSTGRAPRAGAAAQARASELAQQFAAQVQLSMQSSYDQLAAAGQPEDADGQDGADGGGGDFGIDSGMAQVELMGSIFAGGIKRGLTPAQVQAQLAALGTPAGLLGAGAGAEAQLSRQLLGQLGGIDAAAAATSATAAAPADRGAAANAQIVAQVARQHGVDPVAAVAMMLVESGGRATAVGDGGTSFGLFQLHEGGMLTAAGLTKEQAFDPRTNAMVSLRSYAHEWSKGHARRTAGEIAAASQRPADPVGYAAKVDATMERARALLAGGA